MQGTYKTIGYVVSTADKHPNYPYWLQKYKKKCTSSVFEIDDNFIAGIKFLAHRQAKKNWKPLKCRGKPLLLQKYEKNSNFAVFDIANNFIAGIQFLAHTRRKISWSDYSNAGSNCRKSRAESTGHFGIATASLCVATECANLDAIARKSQLLFMPP